MLTVTEACKKITDAALSLGEEEVFLGDALGRVLSEDVVADRNYPPFNRSTMDGFAININDYNKGVKEFGVIDDIFAGQTFVKPIMEGQCVKIMTGAAVPKSLNAVIRVEDTEKAGDRVRLKINNLKPNLNIALEGEDAHKGDIVIYKSSIINPSEISSLAVLGKEKVRVFKLPSVAIISTGNEIKPLGEHIKDHQIRDSNSYAIEAFLKQYNIHVAYRKIVKDNKDDLTIALKEALKFDIIITSGGVSMGDADFLPMIFENIGVKKIFHKVEVKPGKPIWFGQTSKSTVFGLPGNPVSVQVACKIFIEPFLRKTFGLSLAKRLRLPVSKAKLKRTKFDEFFPCKIITQDVSSLHAIQFNGSGDITATLNSEGIALHEAEREDLETGELVYFYPWKI